MKTHSKELVTGLTNGGPFFTNTPGLAARYLVSPRCIQNWVSRKILPVLKIGGAVRYNVAACDKALARFEQKAVGQ
jgi:hypothetical protein